MKVTVFLLFLFGVLAAGIFLINRYLNPNQPTASPNPQPEEVSIGLVAGLGDGVETDFYPKIDLDVPGAAITSQYLESLVYFDKDFKLTPLLAESWQNINPNTWRFSLRKGVTFSNGDPFDGEDVKFTIDTINQNAAQWLTSQYLSSIKQVKVLDPYTIEITTKQPDWTLLSKLTSLYILSDQTFKADDPAPPVGTGPYILQDGKKDTYGVLVRNENYWGEKAKVKKVTYKVIADDTQRLEAFLNRDVNLIEYVPIGRVEDLKNRGQIEVLTGPSLYVWFLGFDVARDQTPYTDTPKNPFKDIRVRQAVYHAIDIDQLVQNTYQGFADTQTQLATKYLFGFNPAITRLPFDPDKARQLLTEAGYPNGFKVNIDVRHPRIGEYAKEVVRQLKLVGIEATVKVRRANVTSAEDRAKFETGDTSMYMTATSGKDGNVQTDLSIFLHSRTRDNKYGVENLGSYSNPKIDRLVEKSAAELDENKRLGFMQEAMGIAMVDDVSMVPLNTDGQIYALYQGISWIPRPDSQIRAYEISK